MSQIAPAGPAPIDRARAEKALRRTIAELDYDIHKSLESDEETGEDTYADWVDVFIDAYEAALPHA
ncbi:hypothetical protein [Leifsonia sp. Leaf264]|uniref:hypothetical protein n=1 Tax=Leifsonia sp. Leaf264 TaxID=1736314 RepID=UPI0006FEE46F|nr:hypothetical protein [Leifsonia sp. Leaf264]KQO98337.1 hypothetical protein ASF30_09765 [Leifsonia sp. Leaf264]